MYINDLEQEPWRGYDPPPFPTLYCDLCGREIEEDEKYAEEHGRNRRCLCMNCARGWQMDAEIAEENGEEVDGWLDFQIA